MSSETRYGAAVELLPPAESGHGKDRWYELRNAGVTATDVAVLMTGQYDGSAFNLYWQKVADLRGEDKPEYARGRRWETTVRDMWLEDRLADERVRWQTMMTPGLLARADARWQLASPDAVIADEYIDDPGEATGPFLPLECKTTATWNGWGPDWSDEVPEGYRYQVLWQCHVLGAPRGYIAALMPNHEVRTYVIEVGSSRMDEDPTDMEEAVNAAYIFHEEHLSIRIPPALTGASGEVDTLKALHPEPTDETVVLNLDVTSTLVDLAEARASVRAWEKQVKALDAEVRLALGASSTGTDDQGQPLVTRQVSKREGYTVAPGVQDKLIIHTPGGTK